MSEVVVIGAGAVGLMTALRLRDHYDVTVIDAGPDPMTSNHGIGATHSGCDARHVTRTETTTWTSAARSELLLRPTADRGWDGRPRADWQSVDGWIARFRQQASNVTANGGSRRSVLEVNGAGLEMWEALLTGVDPIHRQGEVPTGGWIPIFFTDRDAAATDLQIETDLDRRVVPFEPRTSEVIASLLGPGVVAGIAVPGRALRVKTWCRLITERLRDESAILQFDTHVDASSVPDADAVVWATPHLPGSAAVLPLGLAGVIGVWLETPSDVGSTAFKLVGPEPVNYINVTIDEGMAMASGGYSYVAGYSPDELAATTASLVDQLRETLERHLPAVNWSEATPAACIRPSTPTGVPLAQRLDGDRPEYVIGAGCAGGFTQAPAQAEWVAKELDGVLR